MSRWRWPLYAAGTAMMGWGVYGQLTGPDTKPARVAVLWVAAALAHDLVLAPFVVIAGLIGRVVVHRRVRASLQGASLVALCLVLVSLPALGRYGEKADNASVLPRDYTKGLLLALGVVLVAAVGHAVYRAVRTKP